MRDFVVRALSAGATSGWLEAGGRRFRCALGRGGLSWRKREGDGTTPRGRWPIDEIRLRSDRRPVAWRGCQTISVLPIRLADGWCDAPADRNYNRPIRHPYDASAENLWRDDELYDVVGVLAHNRRPRIRGHGSAVFFHLRDPDGGPTAGCIAVSERDMRVILAHCRRRNRIVITAN